MQDTTKTKLDRLQRRDMLGWLWVAVPLVLIVSALVAMRWHGGDVSHIDGTVASADWRLNEDTGQRYPFIEVKLDTGSSVRVGSLAPALPIVGDRITVQQRAMLFDYLMTYQWEGPELPHAPLPTRVAHP